VCARACASDLFNKHAQEESSLSQLVKIGDLTSDGFIFTHCGLCFTPPYFIGAASRIVNEPTDERTFCIHPPDRAQQWHISQSDTDQGIHPFVRPSVRPFVMKLQNRSGENLQHRMVFLPNKCMLNMKNGRFSRIDTKGVETCTCLHAKYTLYDL
jgi:hypothetical protein